jgi:hypothetical protein
MENTAKNIELYPLGDRYIKQEKSNLLPAREQHLVPQSPYWDKKHWYA